MLGYCSERPTIPCCAEAEADEESIMKSFSATSNLGHNNFVLFRPDYGRRMLPHSPHQPSHKHSALTSILTSSIAVAEVREAPHVAKPNSIANTREDEFNLVAPVASFDVLISLTCFTRHSPILPKEEGESVITARLGRKEA